MSSTEIHLFSRRKKEVEKTVSFERVAISFSRLQCLTSISRLTEQRIWLERCNVCFKARLEALEVVWIDQRTQTISPKMWKSKCKTTKQRKRKRERNETLNTKTKYAYFESARVISSSSSPVWSFFCCSSCKYT